MSESGARDPIEQVRSHLVLWAARLVRVVSSPSLARDVDRDLAEPVRRIALEMRDAASTDKWSALLRSRGDRPRLTAPRIDTEGEQT